MYLILRLVYLFLFRFDGLPEPNWLAIRSLCPAGFCFCFLFYVSEAFWFLQCLLSRTAILPSLCFWRSRNPSSAKAFILTLLIAILPMFSYFLVLAFQSGESFLRAALGSACYSDFGFFLFLIAVHFITKTAFFRKYKTICPMSFWLLFPSDPFPLFYD